jgi:hypothetical protein
MLSHRSPTHPSRSINYASALAVAVVISLAALAGGPQTAAAQGAGTSNASVSAKCNDGTSFTGASRKGACSGHGGVKAWGDSTTAPRPKGATAQCNDGSWYTRTTRRGACAAHGGVKHWVKEPRP